MRHFRSQGRQQPNLLITLVVVTAGPVRALGRQGRPPRWLSAR
jgi:hypothetical protein